MQSIDFQEKKIAYYLNGENGALPVVLIHGFCEDSRLWDEWLDFLPPRRYLRIDLPGFGSSERVEDLSVEKMAEAIDAVLVHLGIEKCVMVGHSMGGYASLAFAEFYPEKLAGLCLFHSHPFADSAEKKAGRVKSIHFIQKNGHILYVRQTIPKLFAYDYSKGYQMEVNKLIHNAVHFAPEAIIAALDAMRNRPDRSEVLKNVACPVLFFIGKHDTAVPLELSMQMAHLPNLAVIHLLNTVGHMGMYSAQRETAKAFRTFLARIDRMKD
ncbi:MAG: alpha/beta hydrolase [Lewinellaceae bacterium]|nr:alpha/beta hydrolase [Saprospiraceae bacterium]MCB9339052.1 alpha/beta hydrolase [Lewinellaceae bacterium]